MKPYLGRFLGLSIPTVLFAAVATAETYSGQSRGDFASGWFSSETQCIPGDEPRIASWGYVQMGDSVSHAKAGKPVTGEYAYVSWYQYDACSGEFLGYTEGSGEGDVQFGNRQMSASATVEATAFSVSGSECADPVCYCSDQECIDYPDCWYQECYYTFTPSAPFTVTATFAGMDFVYRGISSSTYASPYGRTHSRSVGTQRDAVLTVTPAGGDSWPGYGYVATQNSGWFERWTTLPEPPPPP